jgi:uncharacterized caspase-like protein
MPFTSQIYGSPSLIEARTRGFFFHQCSRCGTQPATPRVPLQALRVFFHASMRSLRFEAP